MWMQWHVDKIRERNSKPHNSSLTLLAKRSELWGFQFFSYFVVTFTITFDFLQIPTIFLFYFINFMYEVGDFGDGFNFVIGSF